MASSTSSPRATPCPSARFLFSPPTTILPDKSAVSRALDSDRAPVCGGLQPTADRREIPSARSGKGLLQYFHKFVSGQLQRRILPQSLLPHVHVRLKMSFTTRTLLPIVAF